MDCLGLLVRHFFGRFFDNEIVSQHGDMRTNVVQAIGLVATPGIFVPFYMIPQRARFHHPFATTGCCSATTTSSSCSPWW
jgi:fluoride ion exporter CrcB/FEX